MSLTRNSTIYLLSNIINAAIPFLLLPILTRTLSPEEYGQVAMFQTFIVGLTAFVGVNSIGAANRKFYDEGNSKKELSKFNGACIQILLGSSLILLILAYIFIDSLKLFLSIPASWIYSALLVSILIFILNFRLGQWQVRGEAIKYGALQICNSILNMGLSLLLVVVLHHGSQGRVDGQIIAAVLVSVIALFLLKKDKLVKLYAWRPDLIKQILSFGIPLIPHIFGVFLLSAVDRFVINQKLGLSQAGIYMVAVQLSMALSVIFDAINKAYVPWLYDILKHNRANEKRMVVKYTYYYFFLLMLLVPVILFISPWILTFVSGEKYSSASQIIGLLCFGQILNGMYLMVTNYVFYAKKTGKLAIVTISSGLINIFLLFILIEKLGVLGAALAFLISKCIQFLFTWILASRVVQMPWFIFRKYDL
ncbi:lipopolysaccharide biosynthesis protein [Vibrio sp. NTOU-M3]|uniref:lipopolysaccharide biosynthesis protein n=1 Tax=Vibrio sp. NTOU-M3 TaxID=3234954 RepID=UPI00349F28D9